MVDPAVSSNAYRSGVNDQEEKDAPGEDMRMWQHQADE
jgi:hypothetical protein